MKRREYPFAYTSAEDVRIAEIEQTIFDFYGDQAAKLVLEALLNRTCDLALICGLDHDQFLTRCADKFDKLERDDADA
jgi:hypothetical protein